MAPRSRYRVRLGFVLGVLVLGLAHPTGASLTIGLPLVALGEIVRVWASGHIDKTRSLATGGPYAHTRNPLYVGSVLMALGLSIASASPFVVVAVAAYLLFFYPPVIREEAAFLVSRFPEYAAWAKDVPLFVPRLTPAGPRSSRFAWAMVAKNREWRTAAAIPVVTMVLWARGAYLPW